MNFKVQKIAYSKIPSPADDLFPFIRSAVHERLLEKTRHSSMIWIKAAVLLLLSVTCFVISIRAEETLILIPAYILCGWLLLLLGFNLAHDAAHGSLPVSKRVNKCIFEFIFALLGANPYLWKIRHIYSHHPYPNVEGCDADIELTRLLRFSEKQPYLSIHRYQHLYAPLLYTTYTLYWIFYKDITLFFRKKQANIIFRNHPAIEWIKLFTYKITYLFIFLGIPVLLGQGSYGSWLLAFLLMHMINSLFLLFTFLISHHVPQTHAGQASHDQSWLMQQISSSADFHAESRWAYWIFGGFNAHTAHHLFPRICHTHYPEVTKIIRENLQKHGLPYHSFSFAAGIRYHLRFLKQTGKKPLTVKCDHCQNKEQCTVRLLKNRAVVILFALLMAQTTNAQEQKYQNLYFIHEGDTPVIANPGYDYVLSRKGFYIYRNCIYRLKLKNKLLLIAKVLDIKNDSLYCVMRDERGYYDAEHKAYNDTFRLHPSQIRSIRYDGFFPFTDVRKFRIGRAKYVFEQSEKPKEFKPLLSTRYTYDSSSSTIYQEVAFLEGRSKIATQYERAGPTVIHKYKPEPIPTIVNEKPLATRKVIWFTPSRSAEITGLNIGLQSANFNRHSLTIRGVNLNADVFTMFFIMPGVFTLVSGNTLINMPDTLEDDNIDTRMYGLSISAGGLYGDDIIKGVSINGGLCTANRADGLIITGTQNFIFEFRGVAISALRNLSTYGRGLQIGLLNICKHFKGVQIGLWNVNSKRKLPFINWSF
jgi:linoleoyl-CoA desaturase